MQKLINIAQSFEDLTKKDEIQKEESIVEEPELAQNRETEREQEEEDEQSMDLSNSRGHDFLSSISFDELIGQDFIEVSDKINNRPSEIVKSLVQTKIDEDIIEEEEK